MENSTPFSFDHPPHQRRAHIPYQALAGSKPATQISPRSAEYIFLMISFLMVAASTITVLIVWANGKFFHGWTDFSSMALPAAALVVGLPVFALILIDLKRAELKDPGLQSDPYKLRTTQFNKVLAFVTCFFTLIWFVYSVFNQAGSANGTPLGRLSVDTLIILSVAGGTLAYYLLTERGNS
jgi:Domain of unknown function (DUF5671)